MCVVGYGNTFLAKDVTPNVLQQLNYFTVAVAESRVLIYDAAVVTTPHYACDEPNFEQGPT